MADSEFSDEDARDLWERIHTTQTEAEFRDFVIDQLDPNPDDSVLSVGCGPGFETAALAEAVGTEGGVTGIDVNSAVLIAARERCVEFPQVSFAQGDITDLPVADESYELVVAKQVLSQVSDVEPALRELYRVVEPGGRVVVTGGDGRTHVKHTPTDRLQRADEVWADWTDDRQLGTRLVGLLPAVGFTVKDIVPRAKMQTRINDQVERGIVRQRAVLESSDDFDESQVDPWERELRALDESDRFLSCSTAFVFVAARPE